MSVTTRMMSVSALLVACTTARIVDGAPPSDPLGSLPGPLSKSVMRAEERRDLTALRRVTAPFLQFERAKAAGWSTEITGCIDGPSGGMGYHYANARLIDANLRVDEPEVLLYEPEPNGGTRLVGVEYMAALRLARCPSRRACSVTHSR